MLVVLGSRTITVLQFYFYSLTVTFKDVTCRSHVDVQRRRHVKLNMYESVIP